MHNGQNELDDRRYHMDSLFTPESLGEKDVRAYSEEETLVVRMLPDTRVLNVGGRSVIYEGKRVVYPLVDALSKALDKYRLVISTGSGHLPGMYFLFWI